MMPLYILLPFGAFFVCCIMQFWFLKGIRNALIDRHPETYLSIERSTFFPYQGLYKFTRGSRHKALEDADLDRRIRNFKRLYVVAILAWVIYALALFTLPTQ